MPQRPRSPLPPLDPPALERMALRYVERFATTRVRLAQYLARKVRERGWAAEAPADLTALGDRCAELGYIDDRAFGEARAAAMARRGLGARRVGQALRHAGVVGDDADAIAPDIAARAQDAALAFARRRRFGPWAAAVPERPAFEKQLGAMIRAGHRPDLARRILALPPGADPETIADPN